jgi:hypothetical protein
MKKHKIVDRYEIDSGVSLQSIIDGLISKGVSDFQK